MPETRPEALPEAGPLRARVNLDCIRQNVRSGKLRDLKPKAVNRFLRSLPTENQLTLLTNLVEQWGALGADRAMLEILKKVTVL